MKTIRFGVIGCGLMGREFAAAAARWMCLDDMEARPEIVAACNRSEEKLGWFRERVPTCRRFTTDHREVLACDDVDAVYIAVPHHLHERFYCDAIEAGKALMGEKPFGIDLAANRAVLEAVGRHPEVFARCASQFPFYPAVQRMGGLIESGAFGRVIEANAAFRHSSDLNPDKAINWKRTIEFNGEYGCMGDLGMHICHVPFRAGWRPRNVRAVLSNIIAERPDGRGGRVACETWDNATLLCEALDPASGEPFPLTLKTQRISPGQTNSWSLEILGTRAGARFSTRNPRRLELLTYEAGGAQEWRALDLGAETAYPTITGAIFEVGFADVVLQMWAAFLDEMVRGAPRGRFAGCVTPEEVALSHRLFTAALRSQREGTTVVVEE